MPTLVLNNRLVSFETGQTILEVARENDVQIPTLCHLAGPPPPGRAASAWWKSKGPGAFCRPAPLQQRKIWWMAFHFREGCANSLTNPAADPVSKTAEFKACAVRLERVERSA